MRLADAPLLPFEFGNLTDTLRRYADEIEKLAAGQRDEIRERNRQIEEGVFSATNDARRPLVPPKPEAIPPYLNFAPLRNALDAMARASERYGRAAAKGRGALADARAKAVNARLMEAERALLLPEGLPGRPWFKHQIYAPGVYTGYGVKTLPGVREAIELKQWVEAEREIARLAGVLEKEARVIAAAAEALEGVQR